VGTFGVSFDELNNHLKTESFSSERSVEKFRPSGPIKGIDQLLKSLDVYVPPQALSPIPNVAIVDVRCVVDAKNRFKVSHHVGEFLR
jgi:hypothetical protein